MEVKKADLEGASQGIVVREATDRARRLRLQKEAVFSHVFDRFEEEAAVQGSRSEGGVHWSEASAPPDAVGCRCLFACTSIPLEGV